MLQVVPFNFCQTRAVSLGVYVDFIVLAYLRCRYVSRKSMSHSAAQATDPPPIKVRRRRGGGGRGRCRRRRYRWKASNMRQKFQLPLPEGGVQMHPGFLVRQSNGRSKYRGSFAILAERVALPVHSLCPAPFSVKAVAARILPVYGAWNLPCMT